MALNIEHMYQCLRSFDFTRLFVEELGWSPPVHRQSVAIDERHSRLEIARISGLAVFEVSSEDGKIPDDHTCDILYKELIPLFHDSLLVFLNKERTESLWYWRRYEGNEAFQRKYVYLSGQPEDLFFKRLDGIQSDLLAIQELRYPGNRRRDHLKPVTNAIVKAFDEQRVQFIQQIEGIEKNQDRALYAMILLCRLLFLYFFQRRGFLDQGDVNYLESHLRQERNKGSNYYRHFLRPLCEALANPEFARRIVSQTNLGSIPYLGGSLFSLHHIEAAYPLINIPDEAFTSIFNFFSRYEWRIVDIITESWPGRKQVEPAYPEITPDILGAIFESYFNRQSQSSAYVTPPEIADYFCKQTIQQFILDKLQLNEDRLQRRETLSFQNFLDLLDGLDKKQCGTLLFEILPAISILDPACGSGNFLLAALSTLLLIYSKLVSRIINFPDPAFRNWLATLHTHYPDRIYALKRRIITQNLFGVDIVDEAIELTRLRLSLVVLSSLDNLRNLEPLLDIDFNLYSGNSLLGFLHWNDVAGVLSNRATSDEKKFPRASADLQTLSQEIPLDQDNSSALQEQTIRQRAEATAYLNQVLLERLQQFEHRQGRRMRWKSDMQLGEKLALQDVERLHPFHWCSVFDQIITRRGGFDIIMTSPPWEILKGEKSSGDYYKKLYYASASQYAHQGSLHQMHTYKLFLEQCYNLLSPNGYCGIMLPAGMWVDSNATALRHLLFSQTRVTGVFCFENRRELLPGISPNFDFTLLSFIKGQQTATFPAAFSKQTIEDLELFPALNAVFLPLDFVRRFSPDSLALGKFRTQKDVSLYKKISTFPLLCEKGKESWNLTLSTGSLLEPKSPFLLEEPEEGALPVYEGKMIDQFTFTSVSPRYWVAREMFVREWQVFSPADHSVKRLEQAQKHDYRLVFRSIASRTDSRTMLATILPPGTFMNNTLNFVSNPLEADELLFLTALFNSFIVDFAIRLRVAMHLSLWAVLQLPVPRLARRDPYFRRIVTRAARLTCVSEDFKVLWEDAMHEQWKPEIVAINPVERRRLRAELDGLITCVYDLTEGELVSILSAFPFISEPIKVATRNAYQDAKRGIL